MAVTRIPGTLEIVWRQDGSVQGASLTEYVFADGEYMKTVGPKPLADFSAEGLADFASMFSATAVAERDAARAERDAVKTERDALAAQVDPLTKRVQELERELDMIKNPPLPDTSTIEGLKAYISEERFKKETGGIIVGEQPVSTERDEIGHWFPRFYNAFMWISGDPYTLKGNPDGIYPYKPKNGKPVTLSAVQVLRCYECMAWFINACFAVEQQLYAAIDAGTPLADVLAMVPHSWPQTKFEWEAPA